MTTLIYSDLPSHTRNTYSADTIPSSTDVQKWIDLLYWKAAGIVNSSSKPDTEMLFYMIMDKVDRYIKQEFENIEANTTYPGYQEKVLLEFTDQEMTLIKSSISSSSIILKRTTTEPYQSDSNYIGGF